MRIMRFAKFASMVAVALPLAACDTGFGSTVGPAIDMYDVASKAKQAYPNLPPDEGRRRYVQRKMDDILMQQRSPAKRQAMAAYFYMAFSDMHARAIPEYCGKMRVDLSKFAKAFVDTNATEERILARVLKQRNQSRERIWQGRRNRVLARAKYELMDAGKLKGSYAVCSALRKDPWTFVDRARFSSLFPEIARAMGSPG